MGACKNIIIEINAIKYHLGYKVYIDIRPSIILIFFWDYTRSFILSKLMGLTINFRDFRTSKL